MAQANYVPVAGIAVSPIKLITLAIVENCVIHACQKKTLYREGGKENLHTRTHNLIPYLDRFYHRKTCLNHSKYQL